MPASGTAAASWQFPRDREGGSALPDEAREASRACVPSPARAVVALHPRLREAHEHLGHAVDARTHATSRRDAIRRGHRRGRLARPRGSPRPQGRRRKEGRRGGGETPWPCIRGAPRRSRSIASWSPVLLRAQSTRDREVLPRRGASEDMGIGAPGADVRDLRGETNLSARGDSALGLHTALVAMGDGPRARARVLHVAPACRRGSAGRRPAHDPLRALHRRALLRPRDAP